MEIEKDKIQDFDDDLSRLIKYNRARELVRMFCYFPMVLMVNWVASLYYFSYNLHIFMPFLNFSHPHSSGPGACCFPDLLFPASFFGKPKFAQVSTLDENAVEVVEICICVCVCSYGVWCVR